jgi:hypothetical protein
MATPSDGAGALAAVTEPKIRHLFSTSPLTVRAGADGYIGDKTAGAIDDVFFHHSNLPPYEEHGDKSR